MSQTTTQSAVRKDPLNLSLYPLGLLMGTSYQSSADYYLKINDEVNRKAGGHNCAPMSIYNVNFESICQWMRDDNWRFITYEVEEVAKRVQASGAEAFLICSNTLHYALELLEHPLPLPVLHIGDCIARELHATKAQRVALLGTEFTMSQSFIVDRLRQSGAEAYTPDGADQTEIDRIIFEELCHGKRKKTSGQYLFKVIERLVVKHHIDGVVLGCTELEQLVNHGAQIKINDILRAKNPSVPRLKFFESMQIHTDAAAKFVLYGELPTMLN